jgi:tRNA (guanine-N7-)-methyltransferase
MRLKNKTWAKPFIAANPNLVLTNLSLDWLNGIPKQYHNFNLEIGCGKGGFLTGLAKHHPHEFFIGIERALTAVAIAGKKIESEQLSNVQLWLHDVSKIGALIPDQFFQTIYLNFSDPWPKIRHHKRRLTAPSFLALYHRILVPQGVIKMKTDNVELIRFSKANFEQNGYVILDYSENYAQIVNDDIPTEYEVSFRAEGVPICRIVARKVL